MTFSAVPSPWRRHAASSLALGLTLASLGALLGCSPGDAPGGRAASGTTSRPDTPTSTTSPRGWIDGKPDFSSGSGVVVDGAVMADGEATFGASAAPSPSTRAGDAPEESRPDQGPLRAGAVDDNADYAGFLAYLDRLTVDGIAARPWDPAGRIVVRVVDDAGRGAAGRTVAVRAPEGSVASLRTTADGTIRFLPAVYGRPAASYSFEVDGHTVSGAAGESLTITVDRASSTSMQASPQQPSPLPVDVLFLLDATGSMGDEIDQLTANIATVAGNVQAMAPDADLRFGMTLYRDDQDSFVTATYDFTDDVAAFGRALDEVIADGGGDYPEALDEGLAAALAEPSWRPTGEALQLIFVVGDAPPQVGRDVAVPYTASLQTAMARGVKVFPIASSGTDDVAELVFRQLAQATGARFVFLAYGADGAALGGDTDIESSDYEELSLDQLVTRLIGEEIGARTGQQLTVPTTVPTATTRPPGQ